MQIYSPHLSLAKQLHSHCVNPRPVSLSITMTPRSLHTITNTWTEPKHCPKNQNLRKNYGLVAYQARMCRRISDLMPVIIRASQTTVATCQKVFADRRWNCSSVLRAPRYKSDLTKLKIFSGTKEQAFVYALSSAALTHHVAKACVSGDLPYCPCGLNSPTASADASYKWKGCSDNVLYGQRVSREWADASWRKKWRLGNLTAASRRDHRDNMHCLLCSQSTGYDAGSFLQELLDDWAYINIEFSERKSVADLPPRARMNEHNNEVGRQVTQESLYRKCKCHGVSSSCNVRTCWNTLPDVHEIALKLRERYAEASSLPELLAQSGYADKAMRGELSKQHLVMKTFSDQDLLKQVYLRNSPDYCVEDSRTGSYGTMMRECNVTSSAANGCSSLCCGRGYHTRQMFVEEQCQCKYVHCCYVKCKTCKYLVDKHYCK
uniref:Protein Wnt n=1 Tax=Setaria digitata TaxID=48799 RepID=A0A915Q4D6_9BILA